MYIADIVMQTMPSIVWPSGLLRAVGNVVSEWINVLILYDHYSSPQQRNSLAASKSMHLAACSALLQCATRFGNVVSGRTKEYKLLFLVIFLFSFFMFTFMFIFMFNRAMTS